MNKRPTQTEPQNDDQFYVGNRNFSPCPQANALDTLSGDANGFHGLPTTKYYAKL